MPRGRLANSMVLIGGVPEGQGMPVALYLYLLDVDAAYGQAVAAGAASLGAPADQPDGDRRATVQDPFGNLWFLARPLTERPA